MKSFDASITEMLWPEKRQGQHEYATVSGKKHKGVIDVTTATAYLKVPKGYLPSELQGLTGVLSWFLPNAFHDGQLQVGPIPKGTPVNLLSNINLKTPTPQLLSLGKTLIRDLKKLPRNATDEDAKRIFANAVPKLLEASKCRDFVVNRGHYFGTDFLPATEGEPGLTDEDKRALIAYLKTF
jgi:hypothetical protein